VLSAALAAVARNRTRNAGNILSIKCDSTPKILPVYPAFQVLMNGASGEDRIARKCKNMKMNPPASAAFEGHSCRRVTIRYGFVSRSDFSTAARNQ
jgi:hypothetical protein